MPDKLKYPRFGGDRKLRTGVVEENAAMGFPWRCECCPKEKNIAATHEVIVNHSAERDAIVNACGYHVGQARRFHTFEKFLAAAGG